MTPYVRALLTVAAAIALPLAANAADMAYKVAPPPPPAVPMWSGFYIGLHGGAATGAKSFDFNDLTPAAPFLWNSESAINGALGGGQIGFNIQAGSMVFGIEGEASLAGIEGHGLCNTTTFFMNCQAKTNGLAAVTGRIGWTLDRALIYGKGGVAWARDTFNISNVALPPIATSFASSLTDTRTGWTIGMGLEYLVAAQWSAKVEYDYADFGTKRYNFPVTAPGIAVSNFSNWDIDQRVHMFKLGLNYHFGAGLPGL